MPLLGEFQPLPALACQIRDETGLGETLFQVITRLELVFDDQDFHGGLPGRDEHILPQLLPSVESITNL